MMFPYTKKIPRKNCCPACYRFSFASGKRPSDARASGRGSTISASCSHRVTVLLEMPSWRIAC